MNPSFIAFLQFCNWFENNTPSCSSRYWQSRCSGNPNTSPWPWKCQDSKSGVINVTHGNPQLHHDQPDCHFFVILSSTDSCQQSFVLLLLFVIVPNLGLFLNQTYFKKKKPKHWHPTSVIRVKLRTTMGDKTELKIGFPAAPGSRWCIWISQR